MGEGRGGGEHVAANEGRGVGTCGSLGGHKGGGGAAGSSESLSWVLRVHVSSLPCVVSTSPPPLRRLTLASPLGPSSPPCVCTVAPAAAQTELAALLAADGFKSVAEAVGADVKHQLDPKYKAAAAKQAAKR